MYLRAKFEISSIILTSFRQEEVGKGGEIYTHPPQNEPLKSPPRCLIKSHTKTLRIFTNTVINYLVKSKLCDLLTPKTTKIMTYYRALLMQDARTDNLLLNSYSVLSN